MRDECRHVTTLLIAHLRTVTLEIGRRASDDGLLARADDVFFLTDRNKKDPGVARADITPSLLWLVFCQTENFAISPSWYESLAGQQSAAEPVRVEQLVTARQLGGERLRRERPQAAAGVRHLQVRGQGRVQATDAACLWP